MPRFATLARLLLPLAAVCLAGCTVTRDIKAESSFTWSADAQKRVILIQPDVVLGEMQAGGLVEPRADWTATAQALLAKQLSSALGQRAIDVVAVNNLADEHEIQLAKLHSAVGAEIILHGLGGAKLPTKGSALDWTLGPGAKVLHDHYNADYAMFVYVRDSYTSGGRALVMVGAALLGIGLQGGSQTAFVSLVDLRTGNVVWFNTLFSQSGDLRNEADTGTFVASLLKDSPL
ncbi:MAG TPA: hypothetical protein VMH86_12615 [Rhizomicrobium sp.]|nr:hypothetical protein [Rhizomicrobium sp.]